MDDRIQELLERARETAATAGEYAGQMVDTARLREGCSPFGRTSTACSIRRGGWCTTLTGAARAERTRWSRCSRSWTTRRPRRPSCGAARAPPAGEAALAAGRRDPDGSRFLRLFRKGAGSCPFHCFLAGGV
ncbi:hypothetical protein M5E87_09840 [Flavonifractor plautii]|nr:hypothetical protein M5E87_09840 [Flavonifractor plautii]